MTAAAYPALLWLTVTAALLGALQFGWHLGLLNTPLPFVGDDLGFDATSGAAAVVVSSLLIGASIGSLTAGQLADVLGPGQALLLNNISLILGALLSLSTPGGFWGMLAGRFFSGIGAGAASLYVPRFIAETSPKLIRGQLCTLNQVFVTIGILLAYAAGWPYAQGTAKHVQVLGHAVAWWRIMCAMGLIPAAVQMLGMSLVPESPVWLQWKGHTDKAVTAEKQLLGDRWHQEGDLVRGSDADGATEQLLADAERQGGGDSDRKAGWGALLEKRYRRIMVLAACLPLLQQGSGINTVILYSSQVFAMAGLSSPVIGSIIVGLIQVVATLAAAALMDRAGRRLLLLISHLGMGACLFILAAAFLLPGLRGAAGNIAFGAVLGFVVFYSLGSAFVWSCVVETKQQSLSEITKLLQGEN
ncbi:hypothetical protein WJX73_001137 [Symbiochloris irregularis]|uniref:Major facilitator superfamily (MFS) profile domain-containing protein n=1 Tax=Symbiochloris irregularis TaxID=706552 RepID=A0AAW1NLD4_9CHLO